MSRLRIENETEDEREVDTRPPRLRSTVARGTPPVYTIAPGPPPRAGRVRGVRPYRRTPGSPRVPVESPVTRAWLGILKTVLGTGKVVRLEPRAYGRHKLNVHLSAFVSRYRQLIAGYRVRSRTLSDGATLVWAEPEHATTSSRRSALTAKCIER